MQIGKICLRHGLILAPMAGYTDHATRAVSHACGAEYTVTEMVSAKAICYGDRKTPVLARIFPEDGPCAVQIFGSDPEYMAEAAVRLSEGMAGGEKPAAVDINAGCPVPKVTGNQEGSALMRAPGQLYRIVQAICTRIKIPVTVKIRAGWDGAHRNAPEVARAAEAGGASAVAVHGRTRDAMYAGRADWAIIGAVKKAVSIPVIGNGDVTDVASALLLLRESGADGIMIGRGALGNPYIFREIGAALEGRPVVPATPEELYSMACRQLMLRAAEKGEASAVRESRKLLAWYLRGFPTASAARARIYAAESLSEMQAALAVLLQKDAWKDAAPRAF